MVVNNDRQGRGFPTSVLGISDAAIDATRGPEPGCSASCRGNTRARPRLCLLVIAYRHSRARVLLAQGLLYRHACS
jgi:hypothetical protein